MLIPFDNVYNYLKQLNLNITGILHIGAHECEELNDYVRNGINEDNIIWIDAIKEKVELAKSKNIKYIYNEAVSNKEEDIVFNITNNGQSSSILELDTHKVHHPEIHVVEQRNMKTITLETFFKKNNINPNKYNFWNLDIQGAELFALKGAGNILDNVDVLYLEVNTEHLYKGCSLLNELEDFLHSKNFHRVAIQMTSANWGDALYISKRCL
jgi:FkbM family methyltransferase